MKPKRNLSKIVGITGGIGTGKSTVAKFIRGKGYPVISTDNLAKEVLNNNPIVKQKIINEFGEEAYLNGNYNSNYVFQQVFGGAETNKELLTRLNSIVHPIVIDEMIKETEKLLNQGSEIIFIESALIYEAKLEEGFDYVILVVAEEEKVIERLLQNRNLSKFQILNVIASQIPQSIKAQLADFVLENNSDIDTLRKNVELVLEIIKAH